ncbi:hypothetical protein BDP27DRAFT_1381016 [Rhodocollybia butyracea]|uniref:F-box domain-containing protein n=1 Tax=Rhodocollybia butyracea TaxID=206335 RepID=A0A9P5Q5J2_9AGAR|nr:hypothetical protein BDP27DRAFT_1381016 [Rhodocollybia butyracea]
MSTETVLLCPRPYAWPSGKLMLLPLLPTRKFSASLPTELWSKIIADIGIQSTRCLLSPMLVCKRFKAIVDPLLYSCVSFEHYSSLVAFSKRIHDADKAWDSLRRSLYSAPGRWVQSLDISRLELYRQKPKYHNLEIMTLQLDSLLNSLFPLLPFLSEFFMNPTFVLSRRAVISLTERYGVDKLRSLRGIFYTPSQGLPREALVDLLRRCPNLEELEVIGPDLDPIEHDIVSTDPSCITASSPLMLSLISTPLPSLTKLTITPYDDIPYSASSFFLSNHGETLHSLLLLTRKSWPTRLHASPINILQRSPFLHHLSLELPLPALELSENHNLQILSIPKPGVSALALILRLLPHLPSLKAIRIRDVRWLRKGMGLRAMETGVQGEMQEWRRRLERRGIRVLDSEWNDADSASC